MKVKEESEKVGLKFNIQKTKIVSSGPITSWEIDGETVETESDFNFGGSKITADGDCSHEIKRCLLLPNLKTTRPPPCPARSTRKDAEGQRMEKEHAGAELPGALGNSHLHPSARRPFQSLDPLGVTNPSAGICRGYYH